MIRSSSNMAQKSGFKVSSSELTKVRRAPTKRTIHKVFTMRSSRDTRSSRKTRMLELTPVSLLEPRASKMMLTHEKLTTTTSPMGHATATKSQTRFTYELVQANEGHNKIPQKMKRIKKEPKNADL